MTIRIIITILLVIKITISLIAQNDETFEIQADRVDSSSYAELQKFYTKFNAWEELIGKKSAELERKKKE